MNAHANKGFAARVGHTLGSLVRSACMIVGLSCAGSNELVSWWCFRCLCSELYLAGQRLHVVAVYGAGRVGFSEGRFLNCC